MKIPKPKMKRWIKALRSGKYKQIQGELETTKGFCCLGVACKLEIEKSKQQRIGGLLVGQTPSDQKRAPKWLQKINSDFAERTETSLVSLNDCGAQVTPVGLIETYVKTKPLTFDEIADCLEAVYIHEVLS